MENASTNMDDIDDPGGFQGLDGYVCPDAKTAYNKLDDLIYVFDADLVVVWQNNAGRDYFEKNEFLPSGVSGTIGQKIPAVFPETGNLLQMIDSLFKTGKDVEELLYFMTVKSWFRLRVYVLNEDRKLYVLMSTRFLSDPNEVERGTLEREAFSKSFNYVRSVLDHAPDPIITINSQNLIIEWNKAAEKLFEWKREEVLYKDLTTVIVPDELKALHQNAFKRFLDTKVEHIMNHRRRVEAICRFGRRIPVEVTVTQQDYNNEIYFTGFIRDISDVRQTEEELVSREHMVASISSIIDQMNIKFYIINKDLRYTFVSATVTRDFPTIDFLGKTDCELYGDKDGGAIQDFHEKVMKENKADITEVTNVIEGVRHHWLCAASPQVNIKGEISGVFGMAWEITEMKDAQEAQADIEKARLELNEKLALEASRLKSDFLANMSHEVRTPLNGIIGLLQLMEYTNLDETQKEYIQGMRNSAGALASIVNDILDFSKIEAGRIELEDITLDVWELVTEIARTWSYNAKQKKLEFHIEQLVPEEARYVKGDYGRLRQVLNNLLNNAVKFTFKGSVTVGSCIDEHGRLKFWITDTGIGVPENKKDRLFKPFTQAETSVSRRFGGTGLGLSISRNLVTVMGGNIGYHSKEGVGSTFWFAVPYVRGDPQDLQRAAIWSKKSRQGDNFQNNTNEFIEEHGTNKPILVVEDNPMNQKVAIKLIEHAGFTAHAADNGAEALQMLQMHPDQYGLVLMDIQMPILNGYDTTRQIRTLPEPLGKIAIVAMTANALKGERENVLSLGMDDYISKPVDMEQLTYLVRHWYGRRHGEVND